MKMSDNNIQTLVSGAIAFMFGFAIFAIVRKHFGFGGGSLIASNDGGEPTSGAGGGCSHPNAPSTYVEGSYGCNFLTNCGENGNATWNGTGYTLSCGSNMVTTNSSGGTAFVSPISVDELSGTRPPLQKRMMAARNRSFF